MLHGKVSALDTVKHTVTIERLDTPLSANGHDDNSDNPTRTLSYDYLVLATGSVPTPTDVPGLAEGGHHFYTEEAAWRLHAALEEFSGDRIVVGVGGLPTSAPWHPWNSLSFWTNTSPSVASGIRPRSSTPSPSTGYSP